MIGAARAVPYKRRHGRANTLGTIARDTRGRVRSGAAPPTRVKHFVSVRFLVIQSPFNPLSPNDESPRIAEAFEDAPGEIRTPDPLIRSQMLYPAELRARNRVGF